MSSEDALPSLQRVHLRGSQGLPHDQLLPAARTQDMHPIQRLREVERALDGDHGFGAPHVMPVPICTAPRRGLEPAAKRYARSWVATSVPHPPQDRRSLPPNGYARREFQPACHASATTYRRVFSPRARS
ncbi:hypothetical protein Stsp01_04940 [Streptomyces sp. NBRC 13847]|nr:hypothetical protein Stsp01_04940 [Streptomyces sp. NBRC 13847]